jgi:hypothetical protein
LIHTPRDPVRLARSPGAISEGSEFCKKTVVTSKPLRYEITKPRQGQALQASAVVIERRPDRSVQLQRCKPRAKLRFPIFFNDLIEVA